MLIETVRTYLVNRHVFTLKKISVPMIERDLHGLFLWVKTGELMGNSYTHLRILLLR